MAKMSDKAFDLAIVDPPYGIGDFTRSTAHGKRIKRQYKTATWNKFIPSEEYFTQLKRVSKRQLIWGANYFNCFKPGGALVWFKNVGANTLSQCEIASLSWQKKVDYVSIQFLSGCMCNDVVRIHPCQKPVDLYAWCLRKYAMVGDTILDTHLGSGSIAIACQDMGFKLTGYELDLDYFTAARKRLENHQRQLTFGVEVTTEAI